MECMACGKGDIELGEIEKERCLGFSKDYNFWHKFEFCSRDWCGKVEGVKESDYSKVPYSE